MDKKKIFETLMQADPADIEDLANDLRAQIPHKVVKEPARELIMFQAEESVEKIDFNVGEILVTTAHVRVNESMGFAMVMDVNEQKALDAALLMGVLESSLPQADRVESLAEGLADKQISRLREEREIISSTRVNFEVMGGQDPNIKHHAQAD